MDQTEGNGLMAKVPLQKIQGAQNHHLFRRLDVFWVRIYKAGKGRLEESLFTKNLGDARIERDRKVALFLGTRPKLAGKNFLVEDKFPEFLELKKGKAKATHDSMSSQWEHHLKSYFGGMLLDEVTGTEWLMYVNQKRETEPVRKFFNDRKYLSMFMHWLHREGFIQKLPKFENVDPEIAAGKVFSNDEVAKLLKNAPPELGNQIMMAVTMGMRHGEIWSLEWSQINWKARTIHLPAAKTKIRESRCFVMSEAGHDLLLGLYSSKSSPWVFPHAADGSRPAGRFGTKSAWDRCRSAAEVDGRFHDLRHTFLTRAFKTATNPALICSYAGLSLEEAYKTYLHFTPDDTQVVANLVTVNL